MSHVGIVCGEGMLPFAVAEAAVQGGRRVTLFPLRGFADPSRVKTYSHYWIRIGEVGRLCRLARREGCGELVFIGAVVRPGLRQLRPDFGMLMRLPRLLGMFRGGDNHLLSSVG